MKKLLFILFLIGTTLVSVGQTAPSMADQGTVNITKNPSGLRAIHGYTAPSGSFGGATSADMVYSFYKGDTIGFFITDSAYSASWGSPELFIGLLNNDSLSYSGPNQQHVIWIKKQNKNTPALFDTAQLIVNVNAAIAPVINVVSIEISENSALNTHAQQAVSFNTSFNAVDADGSNALITYSKDAGDANFSVQDMTDGTFKIKLTSGALNYEVKALYTIRVKATDQDGLTDTATFNINILDVNEAPIISLQSGYTSPKNWLETTSLGFVFKFQKSDPEESTGQTYVYSIVSQSGGNGSSPFQINSSSGEMTVGNVSHMDYESMSSPRRITVVVKVTDAGTLTNGGASSLSHQITVLVNITDDTGETFVPITNNQPLFEITNLCNNLQLYLEDVNNAPLSYIGTAGVSNHKARINGTTFSTGQDIYYLVKRAKRKVGTSTWSAVKSLPKTEKAYEWNYGGNAFGKQDLAWTDVTAFPGYEYAYSVGLKQGSTATNIPGFGINYYGKNWPGAPQQPANVLATAGNSADACNDISISWTNKADPNNYTGVAIYYQEKNPVGTYKDEILLVSNLSASATSYNWTGIPAALKGVSMKFNVYAINSNSSNCGQSIAGYSNDGFTLGNSAPPTKLTSEPVDLCTRVELLWQNPDATTANVYYVYKTIGSSTSFVDSIATISEKAYDNNPNLGSSVTYTIKGKNKCGLGLISNASVNVLEPLAPKVISYTATGVEVSGTYVMRFNFTPADNTLKHNLYRNGTVVQEIPAGIGTYDYDDAEACVYYTYTIGGVNGCGTGYQDTLRERIVPALPLASIVATDGDYLDKIEISWQDIKYESSYKVFKGNQLLTLAAENVTQFVDVNSVPGNINTYKVQAVNACNQSNIEQDIGFADPNGELSGHVSTATGEYVAGVEVNVTPVVGQSIKFNGAPVGEGYALRFPATAAPIEVGTGGSSFSASNGITVEGWFNFTTLGNGTFLSLSAGTNKSIELQNNNNGSLDIITYSCAGNTCPSTTTNNNAITAGSWSHIAVTFENSGATYLYVNGILVTTNNTAGIPYGTISKIYLGSDQSSIGFIEGQMDEVRIWSTTRNNLEIFGNYDSEVFGSSSANLERYFRFNNTASGGSTKVKNIAGSSPLPSEVVKPVTTDFVLSTTVQPIQGGGYVNVGNISNSYFASGSFTASLWVKGDGSDMKNRTLISGEGLNAEFTVGKGGPANVVNFKTSTSAIITGTTPVNDGVWHNIIYMYDKANQYITIIVDGEIDGGGDVGDITFTNWDVAIGSEKNGQYPFKGFIDDVSIWDSLIDTAANRHYYRKGWGGKEPNLVAYWKLDEGSLDYAFDRSKNDLHGRLIDQGKTPGLVEWSSSDIAPVKSMGITDSVGNYFIEAINYGNDVNGTNFTITPELLQNGIGHKFNPQNVTRTLSYTNVRHNGVDFSDISTLPISGYVKYKGTSCFVPYMEARRDGKSTNPVAQTNANGVWIIDSPLGIHEFKINDPWVTPDSIELFVDRPIANLKFINNESYSIEGTVSGNCGIQVGQSYITFENDNQCFKEIILSEVDGSYEMDSIPPFPNLKIQVSPLNQLITFDPIYVYHNQDTVIDFQYREDLRSDFVLDTMHNENDNCGNVLQILASRERGFAYVTAYEEYPGGNRCYLDSATLRIQDEISTPAVILDTFLNNSDGTFKYQFTAGEAYLGGLGADQYKKKLEATVTDSSGRQVSSKTLALVEGMRKRASTFVTTSPDIMFFVLRDPPGDGSYSFLAKDSTYCNEVSIESTIGVGAEFNFKPSAGIYMTAGWIAEVNFEVEIGVEVGLGIEAEIKGTTSDKWCFTLSENIQTDDGELYVGEEMDLFMGGALNYTFSKIDVLAYDKDKCKVEISTGVGRNPEGIETLFSYTQKHIKDELIPALEFLRDIPGTPTDTVAYWQSNILGWQTTLLNNELYKLIASTDKTINVGTFEKYDYNSGGLISPDKVKGSGSKYGNVSFSYGSHYDNSQSYTYEANHSIGGSLKIGAYTDFGGKGNIAGIGFEFGAKISASVELGATYGWGRAYTRTVGYHLADNDPGDYFSVNIKKDIVYGTPVFETVAGESMCPHEDNTVPREKCQIVAVQNTMVNVPADETAIFEVILTNLSESEDGQRYGLAFWDGWSDGAIVKVNGKTLIGDNGYIVYNIDGALGNNSVKVTVQVTRAPGQYEHSGLKLAMFSDCEWGLYSAGGNIDAIDYVDLNAFWQKPCSEIEIISPNENWIVDNTSNDQLQVSFTGYDTLPTSPVDQFMLQMAPEDGAWAKMDVKKFSDILYSDQFGNTPLFSGMTWTIPPSMIDGKYRVRVKAQCPSTESVTPGVNGVISRDAPTIFGKAQPSDGILDPGDDISLTFNENIDCSKLNVESMTLKGVLSGFDYANTNHSLKLTGVGTYGNIPHNANYDFGSASDFTVEFWVKAPATNGDPVIVGNKDWSNGRNKGWAISMYQNTRWRFNIGDGADMVNVIGGVIGDNQWHHIAVGVDRDYGIVLYQDGLIASADTSGSILTIDNIDDSKGISLGQDFTKNYAYTFTGNIDELRIWDLFKFQLNVLQGRYRSYGYDEANLQGLWRMDNEGSATTFFDRSAHQNFGTLSGAPVFDFNEKGAISMDNVESLVNITWTCAGDKIVIEPITPIKYLENAFFTATIYDAKDLHGNKMVAPYSWTFYVNQNLVEWENFNIEYSVKEGKNIEFAESLINKGGKLEPYTLTGLPSWMLVTPTSGNIAAAYTEKITFSVDSFVNPGVYNRDIVANTDGGFEKLNVTVNVLCPSPEWYIDPSGYQYSMSVTAQLIIEGDTALDDNDMISAFVGDELRGVGSLQQISGNKFLAFVSVYSDTIQGETVNFKIWDASDCKEYPVTTPNIPFYKDSIFGSITNPQIIRTTGMVAQIINFNQGWNWFSLNVNADSVFGGIPVNSALNYLSPTNSDVVRSQSTTSIYYQTNDIWAGSLANLDNESMYKISLAKEDVLYYPGFVVDALNTPITINTGWNYVGYPVQGNIFINTAMSSLNSVLQTGDVIKSQYGYAEYVVGLGWFGSLKFLEPGLGYMLKSSAAGSLIYPAQASSREREMQNNEEIYFDNQFKTAINELDWQVNPNNYTNVLSITGQVRDSKENQIKGDRIIVGAFVDGECRGIAQAKEHHGKYIYYLTLYSDNPVEEQVEFKVYFEAKKEVAEVVEKVKFNEISKLGLFTEPFIWHLKGDEKVEENTEIIEFDGNFLSQNQPNPFVDETNIKFGIARGGKTTLTISNVHGQLIKTLLSKTLEEGEYFLTWNGTDNSGQKVVQGVYYYTLKTEDFVDSKKLIIVKVDD